VGLGILLSLMVAKMASFLTIKAGIQLSTNYPVQFINFDSLSSNILQSLHSILIIFGADFFGRPVLDIITFSALANVSLIAFIVYRAKGLSFPVRSSVSDLKLPHFWNVFFALLSLLVAGLYILSTVSDGVNTYRYFIMFVLAMVLLFALIVGSIKNGKRLLVGFLAFAICLNIMASVHDKYVFSLPASSQNGSNRANFDIINRLKSHGLVKGYANYWQGAINTYLSKNTINVLPIYCRDGAVREFHWLIQDSHFEQHTTNSFYIFDPSLPPNANCTPDDTLRAFGPPNVTEQVDGRTIFIYDYDIANRIQKY